MVKNKTYLGDCLKLIPKHIDSKSIDLILCDLPYGKTNNKWDIIIPIQDLWVEYERIIKDNGCIVLFAAQPFTSLLVTSNLRMFKYDWVWQKPKGTGHLNAKRQPMRDKEDILVFYKKQCTYNPQMVDGKPYDGNKRIGKKQQTSNYGTYGNVRNTSNGKRYPKQVLKFNNVGRGTVHPTQKPIDLVKYLISTYTNKGDLVLDNACGSGTTGLAAKMLQRNYIMMDNNDKYFNISKNRVNEAT